MTVVEALLASLSAAIVVITIAQTLIEYPTLPERVPTGLNADGSARSFGPRPAIWLVPAIQISMAAVMAYADWAIATNAPNTHGSLLGSLVASVPVLAAVYRMQLQFIACAKSGGNAPPGRGFLAFFLTAIAIAVISAFVLR